jgi:Zn-dependent protease
MKWAWKVGVVAGIPVYIHSTFVLILVWVAWMSAAQGEGIAGAVSGIIFILALFGCVVLHEFGHALTAQRYGIRTRDITLLPIGGLARLERMPDDPRQEFWVALAGPAVNVVIALVILLLLAMQGQYQPIDRLSLTAGSFLERVMVVNVVLVVFNMLPAFPMDGGRVLRAGLATKISYKNATRIAAYVGQGMAILFAVVAIFPIPFFTTFNPVLLFIAIFVFTAARQEAAYVLQEEEPSAKM